ncbi:hypothetical protein SeMB42_g07654, partial [Synchytrium endobioticum]
TPIWISVLHSYLIQGSTSVYEIIQLLLQLIHLRVRQTVVSHESSSRHHHPAIHIAEHAHILKHADQQRKRQHS